jgi:ATP-dependent DNA ligase
VQSCFIDGEAIVVDANGLSVFDLLRYRQDDGAAVLCAFDLIELDGKDRVTRARSLIRIGLNG